MTVEQRDYANLVVWTLCVYICGLYERQRKIYSGLFGMLDMRGVFRDDFIVSVIDSFFFVVVVVLCCRNSIIVLTFSIFFFFFQDSGAGGPTDDDEASRSCVKRSVYETSLYIIHIFHLVFRNILWPN